MLDSAASVFSLATSWRVRLGALDAIRAIAHRLVLDSNPRNRALKTFKDGLTDKVLDVRIFAHLCLAGLLRMVPSEDIMAIIADAPKSRRRGKMQGQVADNIELRHGKVLGLSAAVLSHPTDLPEWMAEAVTALCSLNDEDPVIKQSIINTIGEFKKVSAVFLAAILFCLLTFGLSDTSGRLACHFDDMVSRTTVSDVRLCGRKVVLLLKIAQCLHKCCKRIAIKSFQKSSNETFYQGETFFHRMC